MDSFTTTPAAARQYLTYEGFDVSFMSNPEILAKMVELSGGARGRYSGGDWVYPAGYKAPESAAVAQAQAIQNQINSTLSGANTASSAASTPNKVSSVSYDDYAGTTTTTNNALTTLGSDTAIETLRNRGISPAGMSEAQVLAALKSIYPESNFQISNFTPVPAATTGTTFVNPFGPTTGTTTAPATKTIVPVGTTTAPATKTIVPVGTTTTVVPEGANSFMTPGITFPPRTQFNQTASAPLNISQQGNIYGAPAPNSTLAITPPPTPFKSVQPGGAVGAVPAFQNPFTAPATSFTSNNTIGADIARNALLNRGFAQANVAGMDANQLATEMGRINPGESFKIVNFADGGMTGMNNMNGMTGMVPQFQNPFGPQQPPVGQSMYSPQQQQRQQQQDISVGGTPQQPGLPGLLSVGSKNPYPQGYTPIGQQPQNFLSLNYNG